MSQLNIYLATIVALLILANLGSLSAFGGEVNTPKPSVSTPEALTRIDNSAISYDQASAFVEYLNSPTATADLKSFVAEVYAKRVDYYGKTRASRAYVLNDKLAWFARWQEWKITIIPNSLSLNEFAPNQYRLTYSFEYQWVGKKKSDGTQKVLAGKATAVRTIRRTQGKIKILSENTEQLK